MIGLGSDNKAGGFPNTRVPQVLQLIGFNNLLDLDHFLLHFLYEIKDLSIKQCGLNTIPMQYLRTIFNAIFKKKGICKR